MWQLPGGSGKSLASGRVHTASTTGHLSFYFMLATALVLLSMLLASCASNPDQTAAQQSKSKLDQELTHARTALGLPDSLLKPIESQEQKIASGSNGFNYNYKDATANYNLLYTQLIGIEQTAPQVLQQQAGKDIQAFSNILEQRRSQDFSQAGVYQARLDQATKDYGNAKTAKDYAVIDAIVQAQTAALNALWPAYQKLQDFKVVLQAVHSAGINSALATYEYNQDIDAFSNASPPARYQVLVAVISGQINQLMADQTETMPYIGSTLLDAFQARINLLIQYGQKDAAKQFQQEHDSDLQTLTNAKTLADYLTFSQIIGKQTSDMTLALVSGKAWYDLNQLKKLIASVQAQNPLAAYEYASGNVGIGAAGNIGSPIGDTYAAYDVASFQNADNETMIMLTNLRALVDNLNDPTVPWEPHASDLNLMQQYGIMQGRVVVVSLREQTARLYLNGKLVYWSYVTTGRPEAPSPPFLWYALDHEFHTEFKSGDPKGSALWYAPTPINYGVRYAPGGFFLHDAWWRYKFGPGSNLPHWDPLAFYGGSHGCVNFPEDNMAYVYYWVQDGDPIILY